MPTISKKKLRVGDSVSVHLGPTIWQARIVEERGPIGIHGRRLFRVQLISEQDEPPQFVEVPEDQIKAPRR